MTIAFNLVRFTDDSTPTFEASKPSGTGFRTLASCITGRHEMVVKGWESLIDKKIREAMERGEFDNLTGKGEPIDLSENPE